jgi:YHS domain-containing protein
MRRQSRVRWLLLILTLFVYAGHVVTGAQLFGSDFVNKDSSGVALKGYDAVSYFVENKPVKGSGEFQSEWMGTKWFFSTAANRDLFSNDPAKYVPQYGGFCAHAVSKGHTADINPSIWRIAGGKLYLNKNWLAGKLWQGDIPGNIAKADKNWPEIVNKQRQNKQ